MFFPVFLFIALAVFNESVLSRSVSTYNYTTCTWDYNGRQLKEGESLEIKGKLYKVEDCALHRAYHACGTYLLQMVSIACEVVEQQKTSHSKIKRRRRFVPRKLLTEACCHTLCTVNEMTRYCPTLK